MHRLIPFVFEKKLERTKCYTPQLQFNKIKAQSREP